MYERPHRLGLTRSEVVTFSAALIVLGAIGFGLFGPHQHYTAIARSMRDATQIRQIHKSFLIASNEFNGSFPLPSLIVAAGDDKAEDFSLNHSANIYSHLLANDYYGTNMLISPLEVSDHVTEVAYNYDAYDPTNGVFWDSSFVMHIEDPRIGANASYAHVALVGDRRDAMSPTKASLDMPILGTRGPDVTNLDPADYHRSPTYRFTKPYDQWLGNIAFSDNHVETLMTFYPQMTAYPSDNDRAIKDNIFSADFDHPNGPQAAADAFLAIYTAATQFTVQDVYDPLLDD